MKRIFPNDVWFYWFYAVLVILFVFAVGFVIYFGLSDSCDCGDVSNRCVCTRDKIGNLAGILASTSGIFVSSFALVTGLFFVCLAIHAYGEVKQIERLCDEAEKRVEREKIVVGRMLWDSLNDMQMVTFQGRGQHRSTIQLQQRFRLRQYRLIYEYGSSLTDKEIKTALQNLPVLLAKPELKQTIEEVDDINKLQQLTEVWKNDEQLRKFTVVQISLNVPNTISSVIDAIRKQSNSR